MEPNSFSPAGAVRSAMWIIGQAPLAHRMGEFGPPKAGFSRLVDVAHALLVVNQSTARSMPGQQTRKTGQTIPYDRKVL